MTPKQAHKMVAAEAKKCKLSLRKFCTKRGVHPTTISHWLGKTKTLNLQTLEKLMGRKLGLRSNLALLCHR